MNTNTEFWGILIALAGILITIIGQALYIAFKMGCFEEKLNTLDKKQDKYNNLIERMYKNETDIKVLQEQYKVENHRVTDLEEIIK